MNDEFAYARVVADRTGGPVSKLIIHRLSLIILFQPVYFKP